MFRNIRLRIAIPYVLLILITMLGIGIYFSNLATQAFLANIERQMGSSARVMSRYLSQVLDAGGKKVILDDLAVKWAEDTQARVTIIAADGTVIGESDENRESMENHLNRPEVIQALSSGYGTSTRYSRTDGFTNFYVGLPVRVNGVNAAVVRLATPLTAMQEAISQFQRIMFGTTLLVALIAVVIAFLIADLTTRPIRQLTKAAFQMAEGESPARLVPPSEDEVGRLTQAFNLMVNHLDQRIADLTSEQGKLISVLKEMTDGVVIVDPNGRVTLVNPAAENMFSITQDEVLGKTLAEGFRQHQLVEFWQHCHESGESQVALLEIAMNRLYIQSVATPLGEALPGSTLLIFQNLTRQRYLETVRRDFISNLSHELRTPLASLKALTETLQEGAMDDPPAARRFLIQIDAEVEALTHMVSELLELSRIESGRVPLHLRQVSPRKIVSSAVDRLRLQAERVDLHINVDCPADLPPILADPPRLEQVLVNLLHNSIKFTPPGGTISVAARLTPLADIRSLNQTTSDVLRQPTQVVIFSVTDTGVGIPAEDLPRIFERFYKADRARSSGGTGLGLAIARHLIEAHGGNIWAESIESVGSTFSFYIPLPSDE
jgi:two-component system phosphate regulon sensor histidine kinase PhoR